MPGQRALPARCPGPGAIPAPATAYPDHWPATCRVLTLRRFQTLTVAMAIMRAASACRGCMASGRIIAGFFIRACITGLLYLLSSGYIGWVSLVTTMTERDEGM